MDIVERLRNVPWSNCSCDLMMDEAATEIERLRAELAGRDAEISRAVECLVYSAGTTTDPHTARQIVTVYTRLGFSHEAGLYRKDAE